MERSTLTTLKTQGLVKNFNKLAVVNHVDMALNGGEIVGLLGPNGAGKTTCFDLICGLLRPDEGSIVLNDQNVTHLPMHQRARLGHRLSTARALYLSPADCGGELAGSPRSVIGINGTRTSTPC